MITERALRVGLRELLARFLPGAVIADADDLFARGLLGSLFAMELVQFVERELGVVVPDDDLSLDNFRSIDAIARLSLRLGAAS